MKLCFPLTCLSYCTFKKFWNIQNSNAWITSLSLKAFRTIQNTVPVFYTIYNGCLFTTESKTKVSSLSCFICCLQFTTSLSNICIIFTLLNIHTPLLTLIKVLTCILNASPFIVYENKAHESMI